MNNYDFFFWLDVLSDILQIANYQMLLEDATNNDLMEELQNQDNIMNNKLKSKLDTIIEQNEKIINLLKDKEQ